MEEENEDQEKEEDKITVSTRDREVCLSYDPEKNKLEDKDE